MITGSTDTNDEKLSDPSAPRTFEGYFARVAFSSNRERRHDKLMRVSARESEAICLRGGDQFIQCRFSSLGA
jgi:hypothetical protein